MPEKSPLPESKAVVFVVDDDVSVREALERLLRVVGFDVETFASAQDFLAHRRANLPSCLVLDVRLPGLSGLELQNRIAEANRENSHRFYYGPRRCSYVGARDESGGCRISRQTLL